MSPVALAPFLLVGPEPEDQFVVNYLMAIKLRTIYTGKLGFAAIVRGILSPSYYGFKDDKLTGPCFFL
jgi:hypothetical protein